MSITGHKQSSHKTSIYLPYDHQGADHRLLIYKKVKLPTSDSVE